MKTDRYYEIQFEIAEANNRGDERAEIRLLEIQNRLLNG